MATQSTDVEHAAANVPVSQAGSSPEEIAYLTGGREPVTSSVLISNSKYLNNPYYRDAYAQIALRRNSGDLPSTYIIPMAAKAIGEVTDYADFARLLEEEKAIKPEFGAWLSARRYATFPHAEMKGAPPGTLRNAVWELQCVTGIMTELQLKGVEVTNDIDYIAKRRGMSHDFEHMVTGHGPNALGEIALIWANITSIANYHTPDLAQHISAGLTFLATAQLQQYSLHYPALTPHMMDAVRLGIEMGQALRRPLIMEPWEDMLDWQISDIASHLGIVRGVDKGWDWSNAVAEG